MHLTFGPARPRGGDASASQEGGEGSGAEGYTVVGAPYENPSLRGGAFRGPTTIREASRGLEPYVHRADVDLRELDLFDYGDLPRGDPGDLGIHLGEIDAGFPVFLGGDHSVSPRLVEGFYDEEVAVVSLDAHLDYRDSFEGDRWSNACAARRFSEAGGVNEVVVVGARSGSEEEWGSELRRVRAGEARGESLELGERIAEEFDRIHLSVDMDVFDPSYAPAVGNPEPAGLAPLEVRSLVDGLATSVVGMDVVEVVPGLDAGETANLAAWLVREALAVVEVSR